MKQQNVQLTEESVVHPLIDQSWWMNDRFKLIGVVTLIILAGIGSGYGLFKMKGGADNSGKQAGRNSAGGENEVVAESGMKDSEQFADEAEGVLELNTGEVTLEGTHRLIREGGPAQTVYLTSSVVDLTLFESQKVQVKGETFAGQTAGWFMDVGWIKVIE